MRQYKCVLFHPWNQDTFSRSQIGLHSLITFGGLQQQLNWALFRSNLKGFIAAPWYLVGSLQWNTLKLKCRHIWDLDKVSWLERCPDFNVVSWLPFEERQGCQSDCAFQRDLSILWGSTNPCPTAVHIYGMSWFSGSPHWGSTVT